MRGGLTAVGVALLVGLPAQLITARVAAQAPDTFGLGSRSASLAGAVTADVEDGSANYYNPAGLARGGALRLGVGYFAVHHALAIDDVDSNVDPVRGLVFGMVVPGEIAGLRFAFGLGGHLNDERLSRFRSIDRGRPRWEFFDNRPHRPFLAAHVALRPWDWLLVGGGIGFQSTSTTILDIRGSLDLPRPNVDSRLKHSMIGDLQTIRYPQLGVQVVPNDTWSFGLVYRGELDLRNRLFAEGLAGITGLGDPIPLYVLIETASVGAFVPQQASLGAAFRPTPAVRLSAELTWIDWSDYRSSIGSSDVILTIDLPPELAGVIDVPDSIASSRPIPAGLHDRFVPRVGAEVSAIDDEDLGLSFRGGYYYENTPIPEQTGFANLVDADRHVFSIGAGLALRDLEPLIDGFVTFDAHFQYSFLPERVTRKSSLVDPAGDYRAGGHIFSGGLTVEVGFQ